MHVLGDKETRNLELAWKYKETYYSFKEWEEE